MSLEEDFFAYEEGGSYHSVMSLGFAKVRNNRMLFSHLLEYQELTSIFESVQC
jgi:hypothetical protein